MLATGFAVLIGFVVFLAFESFDTSRSGAEAEARIVAQQFETAQFLPARRAGGCRASSSATRAPSSTRSGRGSSRARSATALNPWGVAMFRTMRTVEPRLASEQTAYDKWFDERSDREDARADRTHGAEGVIPTPLWIVLFLSAAIIFVFMLFFADSAERAFVQATMIGGVAVVITSTLLLLWFLDNPYHRGVGGLKPWRWSGRSLLEEEAGVVGGVCAALRRSAARTADDRRGLDASRATRASSAPAPPARGRRTARPRRRRSRCGIVPPVNA